MKDISWSIHFIPQTSMINHQCGDYECHDRTVDFYVTSTEDWRYAALVALHEIVEVILTRHAGIEERDITAFDLQFEKDGRDGEPGDAHDSPYREQHKVAETVEKMIARLIDVDWKVYNKVLDELVEGQ
jgi:hypothetical protein